MAKDKIRYTVDEGDGAGSSLDSFIRGAINYNCFDNRGQLEELENQIERLIRMNARLIERLLLTETITPKHALDIISHPYLGPEYKIIAVDNED